MKFYRVSFLCMDSGREIKEEIDHDNLEDALFDFLAEMQSGRNPSLTLMEVGVCDD